MPDPANDNRAPGPSTWETPPLSRSEAVMIRDALGILSPDGIAALAMRERLLERFTLAIAEEPADEAPTAPWPVGLTGGITPTPAQLASLRAKYHAWLADPGGDEAPRLDAFLAGVQPVLGTGGALTVRWRGMWLCIETDGYCHT